MLIDNISCRDNTNNLIEHSINNAYSLNIMVWSKKKKSICDHVAKKKLTSFRILSNIFVFGERTFFSSIQFNFTSSFRNVVLFSHNFRLIKMSYENSMSFRQSISSSTSQKNDIIGVGGKTFKIVQAHYGWTTIKVPDQIAHTFNKFRNSEFLTYR